MIYFEQLPPNAKRAIIDIAADCCHFPIQSMASWRQWAKYIRIHNRMYANVAAELFPYIYGEQNDQDLC